MSRNLILAIDQGTTNTKVLLVDSTGKVVSRASQPVEVEYPKPAWVEQDPLMLWKTTLDAVDELNHNVDLSTRGTLSAVAISNQRESIMLWERETGNPVGPCVIWQCRRTADFCSELRQRGFETRISELTGLTIDPLFSASKARWLLNNTVDGYSRAEQGELCIGTVDSWLLWNLTGGKIHACDVSNASRTQLLNLHTAEWDPELLELFDVPLAALPNVKPSSCIYGETIPQGAIPGGIPVASLIGDSHGALFGHAGFEPGIVKATYGTGSSLMTPTLTPIFSRKGISTTIAYGRERIYYALEGNILVTGAAVQWLGQLLGLSDPGKAVEELAIQVLDTGGVYLVPAFVGLGAPYWDDRARGLLSGITRGSSASHLARATLESIAYQIRDVLESMESDAGVPLKVLLADGGGTRNNFLMQFQADILGRTVQRNNSADLSALGAAYLAGLATGIWRSETEIASLARHVDEFVPQMDKQRREELYYGWKDAVGRTLFNNLTDDR
jgi:glycerol kinase